MKGKVWVLSLLMIAASLTDGLGQERVPPVPPPPAPEEIYKVVEEMPRFPGCEDIAGSSRDKERCAKEKMLEFIYDNLEYPKEAEEMGVEGMAVVQFNVWKDSTIRDIRIVRDPGSATGQAAADVVAKMRELDPKWRPGLQRGRPVCVQYTLPVKFKLDDDQRQNRRKFDKNGVYRLWGLDRKPRFPDCKPYHGSDCTKRSMKEFIQENMIYPEEAMKNGTEGYVTVSFIIEPDGSLSTIKSNCHYPDGLCEEAIEIMKWMNNEDMKWSPGRAEGRAVRTYYEVVVKFDIEEWNEKN